MTRLGVTLREVALPHVVNVRRRTGSIEEVNVMDGDLGHSSRLRGAVWFAQNCAGVLEFASGFAII